MNLLDIQEKRYTISAASNSGFQSFWREGLCYANHSSTSSCSPGPFPSVGLIHGGSAFAVGVSTRFWGGRWVSNPDTPITNRPLAPIELRPPQYRVRVAPDQI